MPPRLRLFYSGLVGALLLIPAVTIYGELSRRPDIWWTPLTMASSLTESQDRVAIYARGKPLAALLTANQLLLRADTVSRPLTEQEIRLRFNNFDRLRVAQLPLLLLDAAACGAGAVLLLLIATGRLTYRAERASVAA